MSVVLLVVLHPPFEVNHPRADFRKADIRISQTKPMGPRFAYIALYDDTKLSKRMDKEYRDKCTLNCMEKFLKMNQRISQRFQEFQMLANENAIAAAQKLSGK
ncbi:AGAP000781-PA-like protein [Anopheles sinensis]|uniref:Mitochondrial import inner membrane translocase subunit n=1 Tax=Anopheles sinensis TaxID=74873 RepID=A0A084VQJ5_ANOSI|nr:AGAP000781-PA-like protein [Anopheles sinensis]